METNSNFFGVLRYYLVHGVGLVSFDPPNESEAQISDLVHGT